MDKKNLFSAFMIFLFFYTASSYGNYLKDLDFIYTKIFENHPGIYNEEDPHFAPLLDSSYKKTKEKIKKLSRWKHVKKELIKFIQQFNDVHLRLDEPSTKKNKKKFSLKILPNNIVWVTLPTFYKLTQGQKKEWEKIKNNIKKYRNANIIVFDIFDNPGGNSMYGDAIIKELFGSAYFNEHYKMHQKNQEIWWRASLENLNYIKRLNCSFNLFGKEIIEGLQEAIKNKRKFYITKNNSSHLTKTSEPCLVNAKIIVLISSINKSSALNFIDRLKMMDVPIELIGKETKKDRIYTEVRIEPLPSKKASFVFPIKMIKNRFRKDNTGHKPDINLNKKNIKNFIIKQQQIKN